MLTHSPLRRFAPAIALLLLVLTWVLVHPPIVPTVAPRPVAAVPAPVPPAQSIPDPDPLCGSADVSSHYYTYDGPKEGPHSFGPAATADATALTQLRNRLCGFKTHGVSVGGDWSLLGALQSTVDQTDPNRPLTADQWLTEVRDFTSRIQWHNASLAHGVTYRRMYTLYMTGPPATGPPIIGLSYKNREPTSDYLALPVTARGGGTITLVLRLQCGFQPVYPDRDSSPTALDAHGTR